MGSPSLCYEKLLRSYIEWNSYLTKYQEQFSESYLLSLNEKELELLVKKFNQNHKNFACFVAGITTANFLNNCCNDEVNACVATIPMLFELFDIDEPEDIDFKEE